MINIFEITLSLFDKLFEMLFTLFGGQYSQTDLYDEYFENNAYKFK